MFLICGCFGEINDDDDDDDDDDDNEVGGKKEKGLLAAQRGKPAISNSTLVHPHFSPTGDLTVGHFPLDKSPARTIPPYLHGIGHFPQSLPP